MVTRTSRPERPCFGSIRTISLTRRTAAPIGTEAWNRVRRPPSMRRGRSSGGRKSPRSGCPSGPRRPCGASGVNRIMCHPVGSGSPWRNASGSRSSSAARRRTSGRAQRSSARSVRPSQDRASSMRRTVGYSGRTRKPRQDHRGNAMSFTFLMLPPQTDITRGWAERLRREMPELNLVVAEDAATVEHAIADADAVFGTLKPEWLAKARKLRWLQAPQAAPPAGYYYQELIAHPVLVTNFRQIFDDHIGAHI